MHRQPRVMPWLSCCILVTPCGQSGISGGTSSLPFRKTHWMTHLTAPQHSQNSKLCTRMSTLRLLIGLTTIKESNPRVMDWQMMRALSSTKPFCMEMWSLTVWIYGLTVTLPIRCSPLACPLPQSQVAWTCWPMSSGDYSQMNRQTRTSTPKSLKPSLTLTRPMQDLALDSGGGPY